MKTVTYTHTFEDELEGGDFSFASSVIKEVNNKNAIVKQVRQNNTAVLLHLSKVVDEWREALDLQLKPLGLQFEPEKYIENFKLSSDEVEKVGCFIKLRELDPDTGESVEAWVTFESKWQFHREDGLELFKLTGDIEVMTLRTKVKSVEEALDAMKNKIKTAYEYKLRRDNI
jgi:hypothetical protein